ncbi:MAG: hypothetical protein DI626_05545, partial [Micavibrio aeruginosavorus]
GYRYGIIKKYERQFFKYLQSIGHPAHDHDAMIIAALCDSNILSVEASNDKGALPSHIRGMDTEKFISAQKIWNEAISFYGNGQAASNEENNFSDEELEEMDFIPDAPNAAYQTLSSDKPLPQADNDNFPQVEMKSESLFLAHIFSMEQLKEIEEKLSVYDRDDLNSILRDNLNFIDQFISRETRIGRDIFDYMRQIKVNIDSRLNPKALAAPSQP